LRRTNRFLFLLILLPICGLQAGELARWRVAVLELRNRAGLTNDEADYLTDKVRDAASRSLANRGFLIITRESMEELLPPGTNLTECTDATCEVEIGRRVGADYIVSGEIIRFSGEYRINLKAHQCLSGAFLGSEAAKGQNLMNLEESISQVSTRLFSQVVRDAGASEPQPPPPEPTPEPALEPGQEYENLVRQEQARIEAELRMRVERKVQLEADYQAVKAIHDNTVYSVDAKKAAYRKFMARWPDDMTYSPKVQQWLVGGDLDARGAIWTDASSGLNWQVLPSGGTMKWSMAKAHCENLELNNYNDWRLPTIAELRSLIRGCPATQTDGVCGVADSCLSRSCRKYPCHGCLNKGGPGKNGMYWPAELQGNCCWYWSSSAVADDSYNIWSADFSYGNIDSDDVYDAFNYVRCVRLPN